VEDGINDESAEVTQRRRLAGEVAVAALWRTAAIRHGIGTDGDGDIRPTGDLNGNTRGARFKNALAYMIRRAMPDTWEIASELALEEIHGLHLRRDVGIRSSDVMVFDNRERLVAVISSKWTWRSDRGTEAAQMVPLRRYRPDVPYVLVTAEFPRLLNIARESAEDRVYYVCPAWASAAQVLRDLDDYLDGPTRFPRLADLEIATERIMDKFEFQDVVQLVRDIGSSGRRG
jgi:hypothetical protein